MDEKRKLSAKEEENVIGGKGGPSVVRKPDGKIPIDITANIKCPNCGSNDFEPAELVIPIVNLRCKSCGMIFELPELE